ncbi:MAG TPA: glutathione S-transferase family protein [Kofleriaceae bacterium]|nr:glutathione S-transferase family protein [Kofleriaceae bacterium]
MTMLLYHDTRAPNPRRVRIFFAEKGLTQDLELIEVSINAKANQAPEHLARHPLGLVPVLELADGRILRESIAICRYVEELHPAPSLFGADPWQRAQIEQWNRLAELEVFWPIAQVFRNSHAFWQGRIKQSNEFADIMREQVKARMAWLDGELAKRRFLGGDDYSVADITLLCGLDFGKVSNIRIGDDLPHLKRWHTEVSSRPSARA